MSQSRPTRDAVPRLILATDETEPATTDNGPRTSNKCEHEQTLGQSKSKSPSEVRLVEVLDAYLAAAQEGTAPAREELLGRASRAGRGPGGVPGQPRVHPPGVADRAAAGRRCEGGRSG